MTGGSVMGTPINGPGPKGYFAISDKLKPNDPGLRHWIEWFKGLGIPTEIVEYEDGTLELWRKGKKARISLPTRRMG